MNAKLIIGALVAFACTGCLILPFRTDESSVVKGRVSDYATGQPVAGAQVQYAFSSTRWRTSSESQEDGTFEVGPIHQWHWLLYIGSPGMVPEPAWLMGLMHCRSELTVAADGYLTTNRQFKSAVEVREDPVAQFQNIKLQRK
jgi:hypothetical protein